MIQHETLIAWAHELVDFANDVPTNPVFPPVWIAEHWSDERVSTLRRQIRRRLAALPAKQLDATPEKLRDVAERWLDLVQGDFVGTHGQLPSMLVGLSLSDEGELQMAPRFDDHETQFAVTFAELISPRAPVLIRPCSFPGCRDFFVHVLNRRGRPFKTCTTHRSNLPDRVYARVLKHRKERK